MANPSVGTFRFDDGNGNEWFLASPPSNSGVGERDKVIKSFRATGKMTAPQYAIYGYGPSDSIDTADIEAGTNSSTGLKSFTTTAGVAQTPRIQINVPNCMQHLVRVSGVWDGTGVKDRVDQILYEVATQGVRR